MTHIIDLLLAVFALSKRHSSSEGEHDWLLNCWVAVLVICISLTTITSTLFLCSFLLRQINIPQSIGGAKCALGQDN
jgi:hypothetical protein